MTNISNLIGKEIVAGGDNLLAALPDVIGSTIGEAIVGSVMSEGRTSPRSQARNAAKMASEEDPYLRSGKGKAVLTEAQKQLQSDYEAIKNSDASQQEVFDAANEAMSTFLESLAVTDIGRARLSSYNDELTRQRILARNSPIYSEPLEPIESVLSSPPPREVWERNLVDPGSIYVGNIVRPVLRA